MQAITQQLLSGERALFQGRDLQITDCVFEDGESPLKESRNIVVRGFGVPLEVSAVVQRGRRGGAQSVRIQCPRGVLVLEEHDVPRLHHPGTQGIPSQ